MFYQEARPNIGEAENFADDLKRVISLAPPVLGIERIIAVVANDKLGICADHFFPDGVHAPRVHFGSDNDNAVDAGVARSLRNHAHLVLRVGDFRLQYTRLFNGNMEMQKDALVVKSFAQIINADFMQLFGYVVRMRDPNLLRVSRAINIRGFACAAGYSSAEHNGHRRRLKWIFNDQPGSDVQKNPGACNAEDDDDSKKDEPTPGAVAGNTQ